MSGDGFGWQSLLRTDAPPGCRLKAALLTTYDRADERLLVEDLLPVLLKLGREPESEGVERQYFLLELDRHLKRLHDRLVVVSSTTREEPGEVDEGGSSVYGWIWRSIRHLTVGSQAKAVQHAKLWMFHWGAAEGGDVEYLELVISSANLTRAAFKGQLQGAWRVCIELLPKRSAAQLVGWGVLPEFLRELAASAGDPERLTPFTELLARAVCPEDAIFVASVPGTYSRQTLSRTPWGAAGLRSIMPQGAGRVKAAILSPFVGAWSTEALSGWCAQFDGSPERLELVWIDKEHPWARPGRWLLPGSTLETLIGHRAILRKLHHEVADSRQPSPFHKEHRPADERWSHAKVYSFKRGTSRRLLVTSANFSPAAWGRLNTRDELIIENFELGVCIKQAAWPFEGLNAFDSEMDAATVSVLPARSSACIQWARAVWDGSKVNIDCRCESSRKLTHTIQNSSNEWTTPFHWKLGAGSHIRSAQVPWVDSKQPPLLVQLTCEQETVNVAVFDARPAQDREDTLPSGVDEDVAQRRRDDLLFEYYGGCVASEGEGPGAGENAVGEDEAEAAGRPDSYSVPVFVLARLHLGIVDNWAGKVKLAAIHSTMMKFEREVLRRDGQLLIDAFKRQLERDGGKESAREIGAMLAAEEMTLRLKNLPEI